MKAYCNGKLIAIDSIEEILEPGFLFGWGVFETLRVYSGKIVFLKEHLSRLKDGCEKIGLGFPALDFTAQIKKLLKENKLENAYCRISLFKKRQGTGSIVYVAPFSYYENKEHQRGFRAISAPFVKYSQHPLVSVKAISYLENRLAWKKAQDKGRDEAIFLNEKGFLSEASRSNLFFIKNKTFYTPSLECGMLNGITRQKVIMLIKKAGWHLREGRYKILSLLSADEAFLTSSLMEVMPLVEVDGRKISSGKPGLLTEQIHLQYNGLVKKS